MSLKSLKVPFRKKWLLIAAGALLPFISSSAFAQTQPLLRISVENNPGHVQTEAVRRFASRLEQELGDRFDVRFYDSGSLYRDRDVIGALADGKVEIAVPGTWQLDRFEPSVAAFLLPTFFGRPPAFVHEASDGPLGEEISQRIEDALPVAVLGRWLDLGPANLYFTDSGIESHEQLDSLTIRVAGGLANELRIAALGATPVSISWADLPAQLQLGAVDGTLTTHESVRSGALWESGITAVIEDHEYFPQYVPLIRRSFWRRLSDADRSLIRSLWEEIVEPQRAAAAAAQRAAREELLEHGIEVHQPLPAVLERLRQRLATRESEFAEQLVIPESVLALLAEARDR